MTQSSRHDITDLLAIMRRLRDPQNGCPWDRDQTWDTLVPHTLEEAYEVAEAAEAGNAAALCDELGDLLFQVVFYAQVAEEAGEFAFADVVAAIADKLTRRHPHVFGDARVADAEEQSRAWEAHKARERAQGQNGDGGEAVGALDGVSPALPALTRAVKLQRRAARVGFDWPGPEPVFAKVAEELDEVRGAVSDGEGAQRVGEELGDLLFSCVNLARHLEHDPETVLRTANLRFTQRFAAMERLLAEQGGVAESDADTREAAWETAKTRLQGQT